MAARANAFAGDALNNPFSWNSVRSRIPGEIPRELVAAANFPEIAASLLDPADRRLLWHAPLKHSEAIHLCEGRGLFATIRRLCRSARFRCKDVLVLSDSLVVTLASDKGRAENEHLNA